MVRLSTVLIKIDILSLIHMWELYVLLNRKHAINI
jgi:hypothetical protein